MPLVFEPTTLLWVVCDTPAHFGSHSKSTVQSIQRTKWGPSNYYVHSQFLQFQNMSPHCSRQSDGRLLRLLQLLILANEKA